MTDCICRLNLHEVQALSDLSDSQKQIITGRNVVPVGLAMQATVATVTELVVLSSAVSFIYDRINTITKLIVTIWYVHIILY